MRKTLTRTAAALLLCTLATAAQAQNPWDTLDQMRRALTSDGATEARFVQLYLPAGFQSGERESGRFFVELPDCLRWDYEEPFPKRFLLCRNIVHTWNPEDKTGERYQVDRTAEPGLDLLLLDTRDLRLRYRAEARERDGKIEVKLSPVSETSDIREATLHIEAGSLRLSQLEYRDAEGNVTRFELSGYRRLPDRSMFTPPADVAWQEP